MVCKIDHKIPLRYVRYLHSPKTQLIFFQAGPISYAGAVKQENKQEPKFAPQQQNKQGPQQAPPKKKLRLEQMGFGNMGAGFGCSQFTPNQGEEMPTMLHMGYDGEGFGDDPAGEGTVAHLSFTIIF